MPMILKGTKVILRPLILKDAPRFVKWLSDPEVNKFTTRQKIKLSTEIAWIKSLPKAEGAVYFAMDTLEGVHIGSVGLQKIFKLDSLASIDILIADKNYWGRGYGYDAMKTVMDYGFKKLRLRKLELKAFSYNIRAIKLYKKLGFRIEGKRLKSIFYGGHY